MSEPNANGLVGFARRLGLGVVGLIVGIVDGAAVVLSVATARSTFANVYVHSLDELLGWLGLPLILGPVAAVWASVRLATRDFWRAAVASLLALASGATVGAGIGAILGSRPSASWAGGLIGAGTGVIVALATVVLVRFRRTGRGTAAVLALLVAIGCGPSAPAPDQPRIGPEPAPATVDSVTFLLGDPGLARAETHPILPRMKRDIERWSGALAEDGAVTLLVLGDILYPAGLHPREHRSRESDVGRLADQIALVSGPAAERAGARAAFIPGNHDWGHEEDFAGAARLARLDAFLSSWSGPAAGRVSVLPAPGTGGPAVIDPGRRTRLVLLDTAWWLFKGDPREKATLIADVEDAFATAGSRRVLVAAHHPLESGGPHGAHAEIGRVLGLRFLLSKAGVLLQDLASEPYSDLRRQLLAVFAETGEPDIYAGGHEHSLQVFQTGTTGTQRSVVVGSGSKLTSIGYTPGMLFGRSEPGYGKIFVLRNGNVHLRLEAAPARFLSCRQAAPSGCMSEGIESFGTVWAETLETLE